MKGGLNTWLSAATQMVPPSQVRERRYLTNLRLYIVKVTLPGMRFAF